MAIENPVTGAVLVLGGPAGRPGADSIVPGPKGEDSTVPGPPGGQGQPGQGTVVTRNAATNIAPSTYVVDQPGGMCAIADPTNPAHRGKLLGLVVVGVTSGSAAVIQTIGPITGVVGTFGPGDPLFIGDGTTGRLGSVVNLPPGSRPAADVWRQQVGTATTASLISGLLGPAIRVPASGSVGLVAGAGGGYAAKATSTDLAQAKAGSWVDPASVPLIGRQKSGIASPALRTIDDVIFRRPDLRDYDQVDYHGNNDSASAVKRAMDASTQDASGEPFYVQAGRIVIGSPIDISHGPRMHGAGSVMSRTQPGQSHKGTEFIIGHSGAGFTSTGQYQQGWFTDITTSRIQPDFTTITGDFVPGDYGFDFDLTSRQTLKRVHCLNGSRFVRVQNAVYGQGHLKELSGTPLIEGIYIQKSTDLMFLTDLNLWPFWYLDSPSAARDKVRKFMLNNSTALRTGRVDATNWSKVFLIGYRNGWIMENYVNPSDPTAGLTSFSGSVSQLNLDSCIYPLIVTANNANCSIEMGVVGFPLADIPAGVTPQQDYSARILGSNNRFSIHDFNGANSSKGFFKVSGSNNVVVVDTAVVGAWNLGGGNLPAFTVDQGQGNKLYVMSPPALLPGQSDTAPFLGPGILTPAFAATT